MTKLLLISFLLISSTLFAQTPLPTSGDISLTSISPAWSVIGTFDPITEALGEKTKSFGFKSSSAQSITSDPQLSSTTGFSLVTSSSCKNGFNFTTSNSCSIGVKFSAEGLTNGTYTSILTWNGFTINLSSQVDVGSINYVPYDSSSFVISEVNFHNMFAGHNNPQNRFFIVKDTNKATRTMPTISSSNSAFTLSHSCDYKSFNNSGCQISVAFNSQGKSIGSYTGNITVGEITIPVSANLLDLNQKGSTPSYYFSTSNGEVVTSANFRNLSNKLTASSSLYLYLRDGNKVSSEYISYSLSNSTFSSIYNNCSTSSTSSANGCLFRLVFSPNGKTTGSYSATLDSASFSSMNLSATVNSDSIYTKSPNYQVIDNQTNEKLSSVFLGSHQPSGSGQNFTFVLVDLNASTELDGSGVTYSISSPSHRFSLYYNSCTSSKSALNSGGCTFRMNIQPSNPTNSVPGSYEATLNTNLNFTVPILAHILGTTCTPNTNDSCSVVDGVGQMTCNPSGTAYGSCSIVSCNTDFHLESSACISDFRSCNVENGVGLETWSSSGWSNLCSVSTCNLGYHHDNNQCVLNYKSCAVENGQGMQQWINNDYSDCTLNACNVGYHQVGDECISNLQPFMGLMPMGAASAVSLFSAESNQPETVITSCQVTHIPVYKTENGITRIIDCLAINSIDPYDSSSNVVIIPTTQSCPSGYREDYSFTPQTIGNTEISGYKGCRNVICQPNQEVKKMFLIKQPDNSVSVEEELSPLAASNLASCDQKCNDTGYSFADECKITKCLQGIYNSALEICEDYNTLELSSNGGPAIYSYPKGNSTPVKYLLKLPDESNKYFSFIQQDSNKCSSFGFRTDEGVRSLECLVNQSLSLSTLKQQYELSNYPSFTLTGDSTPLSKKTWSSTGNEQSYNYRKPAMNQILDICPIASLTCSSNPQPCGTTDVCSKSNLNSNGFAIIFTPSTTQNTDIDNDTNPLMANYVSCASGESPYPFECDLKEDFNERKKCLAKRLCHANKTCYDVGRDLTPLVTSFSKSSYDGNKVVLETCINGEYQITDTFCPGNNHFDSNNQCISNFRTCTPANPVGVAVAQEAWDSVTSWGSCLITECLENTGDYDLSYHKLTSLQGVISCEKNTRDCNSNSIFYGIERWNTISQSFGSCEPNSTTQNPNPCTSNHVYINNSCIPKLNPFTARKIVNGTNFYIDSSQIGGTAPYQFELVNPSTIGSKLNFFGIDSDLVTDITVGDVLFKSGTINNQDSTVVMVTESVKITDANNQETILNITIYPTKQNCTSSELTSRDATSAKAYFNTTAETMVCSEVLACRNTFALVENKCWAPEASCLNSEIVNRENISIDGGIKMRIGNTSTYSQCNPSSCSNSGFGSVLWSSLSDPYNVFCKSFSPSRQECSEADLNIEKVQNPNKIFDSKIKYFREYTASAAPNPNYSPYFNKVFNRWSECSEATPLECAANYSLKDNQNDPDECVDTNLEMTSGDNFNGQFCTTTNGTTTCNNVAKCNAKWDTPSSSYICDIANISCNSNTGYIKDMSTPLVRCVPPACVTGAGRIKPSECNDPELKSVENLNTKIYPNNLYIDFDETLFNYHKLPSNYSTAKCYDGSQGGFFYRKGHGSGANRWIITVQGGGACGILPPLDNPNYIYNNINDNNICHKFYTEISSLMTTYSNTDNYSYDIELFTNLKINSKTEIRPVSLKETDEPIENKKRGEEGVTNLGIVSYKISNNPDFYSWNHVIVKYCSQDAWVGTGGNNGKHNGHNILFGVIDFLKNQSSTTDVPLNSLSNAKQIIVTGYSAGAIGLSYHGDSLSNKINENISSPSNPLNLDISFLIDSGELPRISLSNYLTYEQVFNYNGNNLWQKYSPSGGISSNPNLSFFVSDTSISTKTFVIQDIIDHEFLNYNSNLANNNTGNPPVDPLNPNAVIEPGKLPEIYPCSGTVPSSDSIEDVLLFVNSQFNTNGNLLINSYEGLIYKNGIHTYGTSKDWNQDRSNLTIGQETKTAAKWFSEWYFTYHNSNTLPKPILKSGVISPLDSISLESILQTKCLSTKELQVNDPNN